jgi:hydrogenase/urease accessory protein HupE
MRRLTLWLLCLFGLFGLLAGAWAHEVRPAYLELRQTGPESYDVLWKVPALGDEKRLGVSVIFPPGSTNLSESLGVFLERAFIERWAVTRAGGLTGGTIQIDGLRGTTIDVLVRLERIDGSTQLTRLTPSAPSFVVEGTPSKMQVLRSYLPLGVEHILSGADHLLFVLALMIITRGPTGSWRLVKTVTAFTVAHSITLSLAALGLVRVPPAPVEAVIALSIVFVAAEIVHSRQGRRGLTERAPWVVAFVFGLLHGFGFAGALSQIGLPQLDIPLALFSFNVGVEIGQLLFIAAVFAVATGARLVARRMNLPRIAWAWRAVPYAIGSVSAFWLIQRLATL